MTVITSTKEAIEKPNLSIVGLPSPIERDQRYIKEVSKFQFYSFLLIILPIWFCTVLPLSIIFQLFRLIIQAIVGKPTSHLPPIDSGIQVKLQDIIPLEKRKYDIVILGATGFTGRLAARHLAQRYSGNGSGGKDDKKGTIVKWAIAGRNQKKMDFVKQELQKELNLSNECMNKIDTILVDTLDPTTMPALVQNTRVVATTAGPYQQYGNSVVEFCVKYGTHYVDM